MTQTETLKLALERYMAAYGQALEAHGIELQQQQIAADKCAREALAQPEQEHIQHCEAGPEYCWKCNEEIKPTYGSEEIRKLREVNKSLNDHIVDANKKVEPPQWWPAIENILNEYGLQAIDFVADFKAALAQPEQEQCGHESCDCRSYCKKQQPEHETHLFEFWWSTHMPTATQKQAWDAWVSAPRYDGVGVAMSGTVTYAFDVTIEDEALKMLDDMVSPSVDDECNPVRLIAGKGHSGYGLYICSGDYPEEGAELLAELPLLYTTPPQRKPLDIKTIKRIATYCGEHITDEDVIEITRRVEEEHKIKE